MPRNGRGVQITESEAIALREARFRCRMDSPSEVLRAALDGNEAALAALRESWPPLSESEIAWAELVRLRGERRTAARKLNAARVDELDLRIQELATDHPRPPRTASRIKLATDVVDRLLELAKLTPATRRGRRPALAGVRALLNGHQPKEAPDA
jgi:hypothetical protein